MSSLKCSQPECGHDAVYSVALELRARPNTPAATAVGTLYFCEAHKVVTLGDVLHPEGWESICQSFEKRGYERPVWKLSSVRLDKIE